MNPLFRNALLVLLVISCFGCASRDSEAESFREARSKIAGDFTMAEEAVGNLKWLIANSHIKQGMSDQDVIALLGKPDLDQDDAAGRLLVYGLGPGRTFMLSLKGAKVVEFGIQHEEGHPK